MTPIAALGWLRVANPVAAHDNFRVYPTCVPSCAPRTDRLAALLMKQTHVRHASLLLTPSSWGQPRTGMRRKKIRVLGKGAKGKKLKKKYPFSLFVTSAFFINNKISEHGTQSFWNSASKLGRLEVVLLGTCMWGGYRDPRSGACKNSAKDPRVSDGLVALPVRTDEVKRHRDSSEPLSRKLLPCRQTRQG